MTAHRMPLGRSRRGFTLVEVMLTLALLVMIMALVWPAMEKPFAGQRLRRAADRVRARLCEARIDAMTTGQVHVFSYTAGGNRYSVQSQPDLSATADESVAEGEDPEVGSISSKSVESILPIDVTFLSGSVEAGAGGSSDAADAGSEPIMFYPDGTTSTARLALRNEHGRSIEISLRGLTGVVTVGQVGSSEEASP